MTTQEPEAVLIDGCIPGWIVNRLNPDHVHVRNAVSGQLEKLHPDRCKPAESTLPAHMQISGSVSSAPLQSVPAGPR